MKTQILANRNVNDYIVTVLGVLPCFLGLGVAAYLTLAGVVWLSDTSGIWPIACVIVSIWLVLAIRQSIGEATGARRASIFTVAWLSIYALGIFAFVVWSSLYVSLWLRATKIPNTTAVVSGGVVYRVSDTFPMGSGPVLLMTGTGGKTFVHNVEGRVVTLSMEARYKFDTPFIATRAHDEDLSAIITDALNTHLAPLTKQTRTRRLRLLTVPGELEQITKMVCLAIVRGAAGCPLSMKLTPASDSTARSQVWSTEYTDAEAIAEKHLPSLIQLMSRDALGPAEFDIAYKLVLAGAMRSEQLGMLAKTSRTIKAHQFDELIDRILAAEDGGNEAGNVLIATNRLRPEQRQRLRDKVLDAANIAFIVKQAAKLRLTDADVARLSPRLQAAAARSAELAVSIVDIFGERLPIEVQDSAVDAIVHADVSFVFDALRTLNFSSALRERLVNKILSGTSAGGKAFPNLSKEQLEASLTPREVEALTTALVPISSISNNQLDFVVRTLPVHAMTPAQQRTVVDELMFVGTKAALEFVSVNHKHMDRAIVTEVTRDYVKTIDREFCLHLTHRNTSRRMDFFSPEQVRIFQDCAQAR